MRKMSQKRPYQVNGFNIIKTALFNNDITKLLGNNGKHYETLCKAGFGYYFQDLFLSTDMRIYDWSEP